MRFLYLSLLFFASLSFFVSCTEPIDVELTEDAQNFLVVDAKITTQDTFHYARLSRSVSYFNEQEIPAELDATVSISSAENTYQLTDPDNDGTYLSTERFAGEIDTEYTLNIQTKDGKNYSATNIIRPLNDIDSITYVYSNVILPFDRDYRYYIFLHMQEPAGIGDYYLWNLYKDNELYTDTMSEQQFIFDENVDGNYLSYVNLFLLDDWEIDHDSTLLTVEMQSMAKEEYDFRVSALFEAVWNQGLFQGPPSNATTNFSNGAVGFFSANCIQTDSVWVRLRK